MKNIDDWFNEYGESHQNRTNKIIHWICIPLIFWSIIGLLSVIPHNYLDISGSLFVDEFIHWGSVAIVLGLMFYLNLSFKVFLGMFFFSLLVLVDLYYTVYLFDVNRFWGLFNGWDLDGDQFLLYCCLVVFVFAWILQFVGHKIEGKKPSFFKDLQFLLIGPAWLLGFIYKKLNIKY
tara:strand:+ start:89 stop:619 length:531 start_codon:yes stop_codon:yes gene_type:complete